MVKLRFDKSKRKYKNGRKIYVRSHNLVFQKEHHNLLKLFRDKELSIHVVKKYGSLSITLSEKQ